MTKRKYTFERTSVWQRIFLQSKVNGGCYRGDSLNRVHWSWPTDTYLERRLSYLRQARSAGRLSTSEKSCGIRGVCDEQPLQLCGTKLRPQ
jgi:hypothetical protein